MSSFKYFSFNRTSKIGAAHIEPKDAVVPIVSLDGSDVPDTIFYEADWLMKPFEETGLYKHDSDELMLFFGSDKNDHENLNAEIELWIENDRLTLTNTCVVFVPKGVAHGRMKATRVTKPVISYRCLMNSSFYKEEPAAATAAAGTYAGNKVEKYAPVDGFLPPAPEGFLTRLLWLDGAKLKGAPYMEAVWFHIANDTGPENHFHEFDELIGFLGSDPAHPEKLNGELTILLDGETVRFTESCVVFVPRGVTHSPILVPRLDRSIIHFSGGNRGDYIRKDDSGGGEDKFRSAKNASK
jgi:hypothetical protein